LKNNIFEAFDKEDDLKKLSEEIEENNKLLKEVNKRLEDLIYKNIDVEKNAEKNFSGTTDREKGLRAVRQRRQPWRRFEGGRAEGKRAILHSRHWARGGGGRKNVL